VYFSFVKGKSSSQALTGTGSFKVTIKVLYLVYGNLVCNTQGFDVIGSIFMHTSCKLFLLL
jgi:hypothetical protein